MLIVLLSVCYGNIFKTSIIAVLSSWLSIQQQLPFGTQCFMMSFLDNFVLLFARRSFSTLFVFSFLISLFFKIHFNLF